MGDPDVSVALLVEEESESHVIRPLVVKETLKGLLKFLKGHKIRIHPLKFLPSTFPFYLFSLSLPFSQLGTV